ncbi:SigE family RNA polymerase sigma factor [Isoptericola hypogeus]|uniref:SigE family RNA polymerase sigma factor n=1 Tax=Isoptericola hypogeus TaxID=300179 RepID=UPI0031D1EF9C
MTATSDAASTALTHAGLGAGRAGEERDDDAPIVDVRITHADRNAEFTAFMRAAADPLHRMAYLLCGDRHRAEELVQQTLERTYRSWSSARRGDPLAYARRILANLRVDTWRRTRREVLTVPDELPDGAERADRRASGTAETRTVEERDAVVRALLLLPLRQRRVVVLRHLMGLSEAEVSRELGMPVGTVKSSASRALAHLRAVLDLDSLGGTR